MYKVFLSRVGKLDLLAFNINTLFLQLFLKGKYIIRGFMSCFVTSFFYALGDFLSLRVQFSDTELSQLLLQEVALETQLFSLAFACTPNCAAHVTLLPCLWLFLEVPTWVISKRAESYSLSC